MKDFRGKIAVVSGGGSGMGAALVIQLAREGAHVSFCDVSADNIGETERKAKVTAAPGVKVVGFIADVSKEEDWIRFREHVVKTHGNTKHINLLFNNAGVG